MRFLLAESVDFRLAAYLRELGHDVATILRDHQPGLADEDALRIANAERRVLVTEDRDFGELVVRRGLKHAGVILLRLQSSALRARADALSSVLDNRAGQLGEFLGVSDGGVRVRRTRRA